MKTPLDAALKLRYTVVMISVQTKTHVGSDGLLTVQVPTALYETDVEVMVVFQPLPIVSSPENLGWPSGFFERTFGALRDDPMERLPQGNYEQREALE